MRPMIRASDAGLGRKGCRMAKAIVIAAAGFESGAAEVIAWTDTAMLFGIAQALLGGVAVQWHRAIREDGTNEALAITSWLAGHEEPRPAPDGIAEALTGPPVEFVRPGDVFEVDPDTCNVSATAEVPALGRLPLIG